VAVFFAGHILADFAWYALMAVGVSLGRRLLTQGAYRALIVVCAVALAGLGGYFIWSGGERLGVF
jgi:arginine exporter protein ArgO